MKTTPVESSTLETVGYDEGCELLQLEFHSRAVYCYFAVPAAVHAALLTATSKGSFFNQTIRGRYRFVRIGPRGVDRVRDPVPSGSQRGAVWPAH